MDNSGRDLPRIEEVVEYSGMKANASRHKRALSSIIGWFAVNVTLLAVVLGVHFSSLMQPRPGWWADTFAVTSSVFAGGLVSFFFYWLVVHVPDRRKRLIIKGNLSQVYQNIKKDILYQVVFASQKGGRYDLQADAETLDRLMTVEGFKEAFRGGQEADEGYYAFMNQMSDDTPEFREILLNLELLAKQIEFVLHNYAMNDEHLFGFFKRLELILLSLRRSSPGYDESKPLCTFIYEVFSGWNFVEGYRDYDIIEKMIADI